MLYSKIKLWHVDLPPTLLGQNKSRSVWTQYCGCKNVQEIPMVSVDLDRILVTTTRSLFFWKRLWLQNHFFVCCPTLLRLGEFCLEIPMLCAAAFWFLFFCLWLVVLLGYSRPKFIWRVREYSTAKLWSLSRRASFNAFSKDFLSFGNDASCVVPKGNPKTVTIFSAFLRRFSRDA